MSTDVKILGQDARHIRAEWRNVYAVVYRESPTLAHMDPIERETKALAARHPEGIAMCVIIEPGCGAPDAPVRQKSAAVLDGLGKSLLGAATVPEGEGIWAASMRSLLVGVALVVPSGYPQEICRTPEETATALNKILGGKAPIADLQNVLADVRAAFPKVAAPEQKKKSWWQW